MAVYEVSTAVGARIRQVRLGLGLTQRELGEAVGVGQAAVSCWEHGRRSITVDWLVLVAQALEVRCSDLLPEEGRCGGV